MQTLTAHDLVDEYSLAVFPLTLGGGKRMFADDGVLRRLRLVDSKPTSTGGILLREPPTRPGRNDRDDGHDGRRAP